jgi:hypothetical protein
MSSDQRTETAVARQMLALIEADVGRRLTAAHRAVALGHLLRAHKLVLLTIAAELEAGMGPAKAAAAKAEARHGQ